MTASATDSSPARAASRAAFTVRSIAVSALATMPRPCSRTAPGRRDTWASQPDRLLTLYQIHSADGGDRRQALERRQAPEADALVTRTPASPSARSPPIARRCCSAIRQARVIAAAHAGWRGALSGIVEATVATMEELGAKRERIVAVIGPSSRRRAYEVGADYRGALPRRGAGSEAFFMTDDSSGEPHFDLAGYVGGAPVPRRRRHRSRISDFAPIATKPACSAIAGRSITARRTTGAKFPPSCSLDRHSP